MYCRVLTDEQIERIHQASLETLERVGVTVPHPEMLRLFEAAGAKVDFSSQRVRIQPDLVQSCVAGAGKSFTLYGRDLARTAKFGQGTRNYNSIAGEASWVETPGAERRWAGLEDVVTATRLADALEGINLPGAMSDPHDLPVASRSLEVFAAMLRNTVKPVTFWFHDRASARFIVEMTVALRGDSARAEQYPFCYPFLEPISPLRFPFNGIDLLYETSRIGLPVPIGPMAQMGLSAPCSVAGTLAQENAEILAGVCITQLVKPGLPVCYGGICHAFDMSTTQMIFSGPEQAIFGVAMTQIGKRYGFPVYINVGLTDSKRPDAQAGLECGISLALGVAAGADIFGHMGISGVDQASSLDMLILQDEIIRFLESTNREIEVSDRTLGLDVIEAAGPGGTFIDTEHTVEHFRRELWVPGLLDREFYQAWLDRGASSLEERCGRRKNEILETHTPQPPTDEEERIISEVLDAARRELSKMDR